MDESDTAVSAQVLNRESRALYLEIAAGRVVAPGGSPELSELLLHRLVAPIPERPGEYRVLDPAAVAGKAQERLLSASARQLATAAALPGQFREMIDAWQAAQPAPVVPDGGVELVESKAEMQSRMVPILASCTWELLTAQPGGPRPPGMLAMSYQRDLAVLERGATMRTIYAAAARRDVHTARWTETMTEQGAEVRTVPDGAEFPRTIIVDGRVAALGTSDPERAAIIRDPDLVRYVRLAWLRDWGRALPWNGGPDVEVTPGQAEILARLAEGDDLETIARSAGVSRRMISKRLEGLREAVGAKSTTALVYWWARYEAHFTPAG